MAVRVALHAPTEQRDEAGLLGKRSHGTVRGLRGHCAEPLRGGESNDGRRLAQQAHVRGDGGG